MKSYSQAGQDVAVAAILGGKTDGTFVEIGSSHPAELSNTYALEQLGWRGVAIDCSEEAIALCQAQRDPRSRFMCGDARTFHWNHVLSQFPTVIDYASVDVDEHTHEALKRLLESGHRFRVFTCEHDAYQRGDRLRIPNRDVLRAAGYELLAADVHSNGCCFEDWLVAPDLVDMKVAERFRSTGLDWRDVLKQGGAL